MQAARLPLQWDRVGALRRPRTSPRDVPTCAKAVRERRDSAAKLIQRMKTDGVAAQCRVTMALQLAANMRETLPSRQKNLCRWISRHRAPKRLIEQKQPRAGS